MLAPRRLPGWLDLLHAIATPGELRRAWEQHRDELTAAAQTAGFRPVAAAWFDGGREPVYDGDVDVYLPAGSTARDEWSDLYCSLHAY